MKPKADLLHLGGDLYGLKFAYDEVAKDCIKAIPGSAYRPDLGKIWQLPIDALDAAREVLEFEEPEDWEGAKDGWGKPIDPAAHKYQSLGGWRIYFDRTFMLNYEMGLGKTPTTIWALKQKAVSGLTLIICPASVRENWKRELAKWWPDHPSLAVVRSGPDWDEIGEAQIVIASYEMVAGKFYSKATSWDWVVLDEIHFIKKWDSGRALAVNQIRGMNPKAGFIGLSGTPITNEPSDLWHQLDVLWPGRFGSYTKFCERYCGKEPQEHAPRGYVYKGLNPDRAEELKHRLSFLSQRVTKLEVAHLLPAMTVSTRYVKQRHLKGLDELKPEALESYQLAAGGAKIDATIEILDEARGSGQSKFAVLTHLKATAENAAAVLKARGYEVELVTGDTPEKERYAAFDRCRDSGKATVLVATMHSVGIGVDLTFAQTFVFAELYWSPSVVLQALGRFQRLSGRHNVNGYFLVMEGTMEEAVARFLEKKIEAIGKVITPGAAEAAASGVVKPREETEEEMLAAIALLAEGLD